jgi:hypothetical protein
MTYYTKQCGACVARHYKNAVTHPHRHKALIFGHLLALAALIIGGLGFYTAEHITGASGLALIIHHLVMTEA